jgi:uncharacterized DUF497 family protein
MKYIEWDSAKNNKLIAEQGISFEMCMAAIENGDILAIIPNKHPYTHQKQIILNIDNFAYVVPYVEDDEKIFLKTIYPSRKETNKYLLP